MKEDYRMKKWILVLVLAFGIQASWGISISGDGRIRVGIGSGEDPINGLPQYTVDGGDPLSLSVPSSYTGSSFRISLDGSVIGGKLYEHINEDGLWVPRGAIWQQIGVMDGTPFYSEASLLSSLEGDYYDFNIMNDMSLNGEYLVGTNSDYWGRHQAVYWDENRDVQSLGSMYYDSLLYDDSIAYGVTNDKIIVGGVYGEGAPSSLGFLWDQEHGMRYIKDVLEQGYGYDFGDSVLDSADFYDPYSTIINGSGYTSTGESFFWTAIIPEPGTVFLLGVGCLVFRRWNGSWNL
jgi:hypothetical protein